MTLNIATKTQTFTIAAPCRRQIPSAIFAVGVSAGTMTLPCDRRKDHDGPHRVHLKVEGWRVTIEGENHA